jgi:hypothetical protein
MDYLESGEYWMLSLDICNSVILLEKAAKTKVVHVGEQIM